MPNEVFSLIRLDYVLEPFMAVVPVKYYIMWRSVEYDRQKFDISKWFKDLLNMKSVIVWLSPGICALYYSFTRCILVLVEKQTIVYIWCYGDLIHKV